MANSLLNEIEMKEYEGCIREGLGEEVEETIDGEASKIFPLPSDLSINDVQ